MAERSREDHVIGEALAHLGGATFGIFGGRPLARRVVPLILPPRPQPVLACLWRVGGKPLPGVGSGARAAARRNP